MSWNEISTNFERTWNWRSIVDEKYPHIEDADDLWNEIQEEIGDDNAAHVLPLLKKEAE